MPTSLVGSIGVIFLRPVIQELLTKIGVSVEVTHEGKLKGMFQPWHEPTPDEQAKMKELTAEYYDWFVNTVAEARGLDLARVREYATGEVFTGAKAKEIGLIDELGDFEAAVKKARSLADVPEKPKLQFVRPRRPLLERVLSRGVSPGAVAAAIEERILPRIEFR